MADDNWGEMTVTVPKDTLVAMAITLSLNEDGAPHIGTAIHVPDKAMGAIARAMTPGMLRKVAQEIEDGNWTYQFTQEKEQE